MYLLDLYFENTSANGNGVISFRRRDGIAKWTILGSRRADHEVAQLAALVCGGVPFLSGLADVIPPLCGDSAQPLRVECVLARHLPHDGPSRTTPLAANGFCFSRHTGFRQLGRREWQHIPPELPNRGPTLSNGNSAYFLLGYGPRLTLRESEDFDFEDPMHRVSRWHSVLRPGAAVTNPVAFLTRLHHKAVRSARFPAVQTMRRMTDLFRTHLQIDTSRWWDKDCRFEREWGRLQGWQRRAALPVIDAVRQAVDASPRMGHPLTAPGVVILDRPDMLCPEFRFAKYMRLFEAMLPTMQFIVTLAPRNRRRFPRDLRCQRLPLPVSTPPSKKRQETPSPSRGSILLVDVDGRLPNVALMKLSAYFKGRSRRVHLVRQEAFLRQPHEVWASCVFHAAPSLRRVSRLRAHYGDSLRVGGSGIDLTQRLPADVEALPADYALYPELGDRAIGFLTRGCPGTCAFCVVPVKEGPPRQVADLDDLLQGRSKLILLDDNILAHPNAAELLEAMVRRDIQVNFNQTLDIRRFDVEKARLLRRIRCQDVRFKRANYHFSLNDTRGIGLLRREYERLGFGARDNVEFICMYGYNTTLAEDVERFRFLRSLPGAYVFTQRYRPFPGAPKPNLDNFFGENADALLDELVRIVFTQNMKSMEVYYRWVSCEFARKFGRLHKGLVDTIFRYNNRHAKGRYLSTVAGTRPMDIAGPGRGFEWVSARPKNGKRLP
jgi:hypothetical protein